MDFLRNLVAIWFCSGVGFCSENQAFQIEPELPDPWIRENTLEPSDSSEVPTTGQRLGSISTDPDDVHFMLYYSPRHPTRYDRLFLNERQTITHARFKKNAPVIFITHGFLSGALIENSTVPVLKNAFLSMSIVNIIGVDWSKLARRDVNGVAFLSYAEVTQNVPIVGTRVAEMIEFLIELKIIPGPEAVHLIGHSLGAHAMGVAGDEIQNRTGTKIDRITGLDPAGPLYQFINKTNKLDPGDAAYIDVLHTDVGMFGSSEILGTADFYANGGKGFAQPECFNFTQANLGTFLEGVSGICSHGRAYLIYARTIRMSQPEMFGCRCRIRIPSAFLPTSCTLREIKLCPDKVLYGYYGPRTASGTYYVDTEEARDVPFFEAFPSLPIPTNNQMV